ncbi:Acyl-coenzyme A thioesterase 13-like protein 2 [Colletotrichum chlorophyti]|uniref:Acyl-coenzyme A thioesterase 13-like protein 2 n=1 Tax=Colletotrichum chlorophyti TaxID=708187 RepID=A0A1Q8RHE3_9PEZI|nr:Acyl-coenzyme A thioesterase 13-like protein 2 [Colletotrichum chlorophyti]
MSSTPSQPPPPAATPTESDPATFAHIENYISTRCNASPIYAFLFNPGLRLTHASKGLILARLPLTPNHLNSSGSIHGSVSATIVDWAGGLAIAAWDLREATGVSVDINISYLSGAKAGDEIEIEGKVEKVGGSLAFTHVNIYKVAADGTRGATVANGRHTKFVRSR